MSTLEKLDQLFSGIREEVSIDEITNIMDRIPQGEMKLTCLAVDDTGMDVNIDFVKQGGRWVVTGYQRIGREQ